ncbi:hypothetical protein HPG69_017980 [Diceros bicornis minor]|uniref:B30.2/SPRY domain-containing protein n=1 Tax=Diceros bicornis minor TaxID=77932 RepID=A0A7J7F4J7_DICBM|nr:hypothetical protein HPG69_017980 [Diceros bicornis minor]
MWSSSAVFGSAENHAEIESTLDPETAHPNLLVSEDKKICDICKEKAKSSSKSIEITAYPVVVGSEGFDSSRHYQEVQADNKP